MLDIKEKNKKKNKNNRLQKFAFFSFYLIYKKAQPNNIIEIVHINNQTLLQKYIFFLYTEIASNPYLMLKYENFRYLLVIRPTC